MIKSHPLYQATATLQRLQGRAAPVRYRPAPALSLQDVFLALDDLGQLAEALNNLSSLGNVSPAIRSLISRLDIGLDALRVQVDDAVQAEGVRYSLWSFRTIRMKVKFGPLTRRCAVIVTT